MNCVLSFLVLLLCYDSVYSAKILAVFPVTGGSHYILGSGFTRVLVEAGHDVTLISPFEQKNPPKTGGKWTDIVLTGSADAKMTSNVNLFDIGAMPVILSIPFMVQFGNTFTTMVLEHPNVKKLLESDEKFDVVIVQQFENDAMKGFAHHFNAHLIVFNSLPANSWVNGFVGNPSPPSYIPNTFLSFSPHMTFCERLQNTLFTILSELVQQVVSYPMQNRILQEHFPKKPQLSDLLYNASLVFLNSHVSINQPRPHVPKMVEIGGFHIVPPKKLPKDLQEYLDSAKDGVIYFSMGSNLKSTNMPIEKKNLIMKVFSQLNQKVLWKWEEDVLPGKPENVKTGKWLPQSDILAHPNVKLFITHGGLLSTTETIYHGKPTLALPVFGDQMINAGEQVNSGFARSLNFFEFTEEEFYNAITELLNNPKYAENAQRRSKIMHDRPQTPQQTLAYWVDYVIRHNGAPHLRVAALDLNWYQYLLLDVALFLVVTTVILIIALKVVVKKICKCRKQKTQAKKVKTN